MRIEIKEILDEEAYNFLTDNLEMFEYSEKPWNEDYPKSFHNVEFDTENLYDDDLWLFFYNLNWMI